MTTFSQVMAALRNGMTQEELNDTMQEVVEAVKEHRKAGEITIKLKITPNADTVFVSDTITAKKPEPERSKTIFFTDDHGNLLRRDPNQHELPLREVKDAETDAVEPKEA